MWNLPFTHRKLTPGMALAALLTGLLWQAGSTAAQTIGNWQFGTQQFRDSRQQMASLPASTMLGGSTGDYAPVLTLSCVEGDNEHWQQQLELQEPLSSRGIITLWASFDGADPVAQPWVVTGSKRTVTPGGHSRDTTPHARPKTQPAVELGLELAMAQRLRAISAGRCSNRGLCPGQELLNCCPWPAEPLKVSHFLNALNGLDGALDLRRDGKVVAKRNLNLAP